jgi:hypothetical protein
MSDQVSQTPLLIRRADHAFLQLEILIEALHCRGLFWAVCSFLSTSDRSSYPVCKPAHLDEETKTMKYLLRASLVSRHPHHLLAASTQLWQAEALLIVETQYTKMELVIHIASRLFTLNYLLDRAIHDVTDNSDLFLLAKPENTTDSLPFNGRIPLWLQNVDAICNRKI